MAYMQKLAFQILSAAVLILIIDLLYVAAGIATGPNFAAAGGVFGIVGIYLGGWLWNKQHPKEASKETPKDIRETNEAIKRAK